MAIITIRTLIVFLCIYLSLRLMGKRQLGELEPSELVVAVLISDLAAHPLQDIGIPLINGLIPVAILLSCELIISWLNMKSSRFRSLCFGTPSVLLRNGKIMEKELKKNRFTLDELCEELRSRGVTDLSSVRYAVLETDGTLSVLLRVSEQPVTPSQLGINVSDGGLPVTLISDGKPVRKNLRFLGKDEAWLHRELSLRGISSPDQVLYMTVDDLDRIYLIPREERK